MSDMYSIKYIFISYNIVGMSRILFFLIVSMKKYLQKYNSILFSLYFLQNCNSSIVTVTETILKTTKKHIVTNYAVWDIASPGSFLARCWLIGLLILLYNKQIMILMQKYPWWKKSIYLKYIILNPNSG